MRRLFWTGSTPGAGYALRGSTQVNPQGSLHNYPPLPTYQGIIDANGAGYINRRSGPGTNYGVVGTINDGEQVTIVCVGNGTPHTGRYGTTALWNRLLDGT